MPSAGDWLLGTAVVAIIFSRISSVPPDNQQHKITRNTTTCTCLTSNFAIANHKDHVACGRETDRQTDGQTDGRTDGRTDGQTDGRTDAPLNATQGQLTAITDWRASGQSIAAG
jgi:ribosomal protein S27AE